MKKFHVLFAFLLIAAMLLSSCSIFENLGGGGQKPQILPFPENAFAAAKKQGVIGSITQTGDGNAYVMGTEMGTVLAGTGAGLLSACAS